MKFINWPKADHGNVPMDEQPTNTLNTQELPQFLPPEPPKKRGLIVFLIIFIIVMAFASFFIIKNLTSTSDASTYGSVTLQPKSPNFFQTIRDYIFNSNDPLSGQQEDRINILLLGIGGPGHDGPYLSDTNIILSVKPSTNQISMISIPRDLMAKIDDHGYRKINSADAFGEAELPGSGGEYATKIFEDTFNIKIPYYVRVDFTAFKDLVDAVGGVTINVTNPFTDTSFPGPGTSYETVSFTAGTQQMDGDRALIFARSRHGNNGEGSDFARAKRQQMVLAALKQKFLSAETYLNPVKIQEIFQSISSHVTTNLDLNQMIYLAGMGKDLNGGDIKTLVLDDSPTGFLKPITSEDGAFLLVPKTGDYVGIDSAIYGIFDATSTPTIETPVQTVQTKALPGAKIEIQNGTWRLGLAARTKQNLEEKGFAISYISNSSMRPVANTTMYILNPNVSTEVVKQLEQELNVQPSNTLPNWLETNYDDPTTTINESGVLKHKADTEILVILGEDTPE